MVRIRPANSDDFGVCKALYDDAKADILYNERYAEELSETKKGKGLGLTLEDEVFIDNELELTLDKFQTYLNSDYQKVYVFENDKGDIIAFVIMYATYRFRYKLEIMQIKEKCISSKLVEEILDLLISQKGISAIDVTTDIKAIQKILLKNGFHKRVETFFRKEKPK